MGRKKLYMELYKGNFSQSNRNNENLVGDRAYLTLLLDSENTTAQADQHLSRLQAGLAPTKEIGRQRFFAASEKTCCL